MTATGNTFNYTWLEPFEYICYVLEQLPYADTVEKLEALLPWNVKGNGVLSKYTSRH